MYSYPFPFYVEIVWKEIKWNEYDPYVKIGSNTTTNVNNATTNVNNVTTNVNNATFDRDNVDGDSHAAPPRLNSTFNHRLGL